MIRNLMIKKCLMIGIILLFIGTCIPLSPAQRTDDFDPLVDIEVTVNILTLRLLEDIDVPYTPDFFIRVLINSEEFQTPVWHDTPYLYNLNWTATFNVPDDVEHVSVMISVCDNRSNGDGLTTGYIAAMIYNIKTGHWTGDDNLGDFSGYGRLNSNSAGKSINQPAWNYDLWFDISQNDYDGDGIPHWIEVNEYRTDPMVNDRGKDFNSDGIPIEWDWKWDYDPMKYDGHELLDPDNDSINNYEEFLTSQWFSDPFRKDFYIEIDTMTESPLGQNSSISSHAKELFITAFDRRDIVCHLDDGCMGGGGELIPFDRKLFRSDLRTLYTEYFLHHDSENWRRGVFRYALVVYGFTGSGMAYEGNHPWLCWHALGTNTFVISMQDMRKWSLKLLKPLDVVLASVLMHETGHTFGIDFLFPVGCDMKKTVHPRNLAFWVFRNYKSCMNYRYVYSIVDYSDGSHGWFDYDDWSHLDFSFFEEKMTNSW